MTGFKNIVSCLGSKRLVENCLIGYFLFSLLFPTMRVLVISGKGAENIGELLFSMLPEFFLLVFVGIVAVGFVRNSEKTKLTWFDIVFLGFIVTNIVLGLILSANVHVSIYAVRLTYLPMIFYFVARFGLQHDRATYERILEKLNLIFVATAVVGLLIYFFAIGIDDYMVERADGIVNFYCIRRMNSILWTPVVWATLMGVASVYNFYKLNKKFSYKSLLFFLIVWTSLFLSVSRGAFLAFTVCFILLVFFQRRIKTLLIILISCSIIVGLLTIWDREVARVCKFLVLSPVYTAMNMIGVGSNQQTLLLENAIDETRMQFWHSAINDFLKQPYGYGLGKAGHVARRFYGFDDTNASVYSTDGWYLKMACETGVWGILSFLTICVIFFIQSVKYLIKDRSSIFLFFFLVFIFVGIQNIGSNVLDFYFFANLYWLIIGFAQNMINDARIRAK